jgi:hypothetical protein
MKIFKSLSRWWDSTHGGEWKIHIDFVVEPGESLVEGFRQAVESKGEEPFWQVPLMGGQYYKVHLTASIHEDPCLWG